MNKGQILGYKWIYYIVAIFLLATMFIYLHQAFQSYQLNKLACAEKTTDEIMIEKIIYAPCFTYYDRELQKSIPATIDLSKFTEANLEACFPYLKKDISLNINNQTIGATLASPWIINKAVHIYNNGEKSPATLAISFEKPTC